MVHTTLTKHILLLTSHETEVLCLVGDKVSEVGLVESPEVEDAQPDSVELPVVQFTALVGAAVLAGPNSLGHVQCDLLEILHGQKQTGGKYH